VPTDDRQRPAHRFLSERKFFCRALRKRNSEQRIARFWFYPETSDRYTKFLESIRLLISDDDSLLSVNTTEEQEGYQEGRRYLIEVLASARNQKLVAAVKAKRKFTCEACGFNFKDFYGTIGDGFVEAHHNIPIHSGVRTSKAEDIDVLCANCHRMVHKKSPPLTVSHLKSLIEAEKRRTGLRRRRN
jgi:predicted HNH restriction endonuclease